MNLENMIQTLRSEMAAIDDAITVLERLASSQRRRRGRPPAWMQVNREEGAGEEKVGKRGGRRKMSEETKKKMAEAQRKRWAAYRKEKHA